MHGVGGFDDMALLPWFKIVWDELSGITYPLINLFIWIETLNKFIDIDLNFSRLWIKVRLGD